MQGENKKVSSLFSLGSNLHLKLSSCLQQHKLLGSKESDPALNRSGASIQRVLICKLGREGGERGGGLIIINNIILQSKPIISSPVDRPGSKNTEKALYKNKQFNKLQKKSLVFSGLSLPFPYRTWHLQLSTSDGWLSLEASPSPCPHLLLYSLTTLRTHCILSNGYSWQKVTTSSRKVNSRKSTLPPKNKDQKRWLTSRPCLLECPPLFLPNLKEWNFQLLTTAHKRCRTYTPPASCL